MKNLILFFRKYRILFVFLLIQFLVLRTYFNNIQYPRSKLFSLNNDFNVWIYEKRAAAVNYWNLKEHNDALIIENASLRNQLTDNFFPLQRRLYFVNDTLHERQYSYVPARVINSTYTRANNFMTINAGANLGIEEEMGVISDNGMIGFVVSVSEHYALIKTALTENYNINAMLAKSKEHGLLKWNGKHHKYVQLTGIPKDVDIKQGDTIVSRGSAGIFPPHIPIGTVNDVSSEAGESFATVDIELFVNFSSVYHVYVIINHMKQEQRKLEAQIERDNEE